MYILNSPDTNTLRELATELTTLHYNNTLLSYYKNNKLYLYLGLIVSARAFKEKYPDMPLCLDTIKKSITINDVEYFSHNITRLLNLFYISNTTQPHITFISTNSFKKMEELFSKFTDVKRLTDLEAACKNIDPKLIIARYQNAIFVVTKSIVDTDTSRNLKNAIYALIPHFFDLTDILTELEQHLLNEILLDAKMEIDKTALLLDLLQPLKDNRREKDIQKIYNALSHHANNEEERLLSTIDTFQSKIEHLLNELHNCYDRLNEKNIELQKLKLYTDKYSEELQKQAELILDYLHQVKALLEVTITQPDETLIKMLIRTPVRYYDPEPLEATLTNARWEEDMIGALSQDELNITKILLTETFIRKKYDFYTIVGASINLTHRCINTDLVPQPTATQYYAYPHPHISRYRCLGENATIILKHLNKSEWIEAINQTIGACYNINFTDSIVFKEFCKNLNDPYDAIKCFHNKETGEMFSFRDLKRKYRHVLYMQDITEEYYNNLKNIEMEEENESN